MTIDVTEQAEGLLDLLESDFGQSGRDVRIEMIRVEIEDAFAQGAASRRAKAMSTETCCEMWNNAKLKDVKVSFEWVPLIRWESYAPPSSPDAPGQLSGWVMAENLSRVRFCPWCGADKDK